MKKQVLLPLLLTSILLQAQSPDILWQRTIGGSLEDKAVSMEPTADGGFIVGGFSASGISGDKTEDNRGPSLTRDYWLLRLNADGDVLWQQTIGGNNDDQLSVVLPTPDGGFIVGGSSFSGISGDKTEPNESSSDYWILKLDADGDILWQRNYGSNGSEVLTSLQLTSDGGYMIGGISGGNISGDKTEPNRGDVDYWIIKLDAAGNEQWQKTIGGNKEDYLYAAFQTADGGFMVAGSSKSTPSGERTLDLIGTSDIWFLKLDADGDILWQESIGSNAKDRINSMYQTPDGGYMIAGYSPGNIYEDKTENSLGTDYWVIKVDALGVIEWQNTIGSSGLDLLNKAVPTADGGLIAVGSSNSTAFADKTEAGFGGYDYWVLKINDGGSIAWDKTLGGSADDEPFGVCVTASGDIAVAGYSSSGISGNKTESSRGAQDYWLLTLGTVVVEPCAVAPDGLYADFLTPSTAKLHWNTDPGAVKYKVQYKKTTVGGWTNTNAVTNEKNLFSLSPATTYEFRVKSICGGGLQSGWSETAVFTTDALRIADSCQCSFTYSIQGNTCDVTNTTHGGDCIGGTTFTYTFCGDEPSNLENPTYNFTDTFCICLFVEFMDGNTCTTCSDTLVFTGISIDEELTWKLFPNPAHEILYAFVPGLPHVLLDYQIMDVFGQTVDSGKLENGQYIDISLLPAGFYILSLPDYRPLTFTKLQL
jgi:hypothetical protein